VTLQFVLTRTSLATQLLVTPTTGCCMLPRDLNKRCTRPRGDARLPDDPRGLSAEDAYALMSVAADFTVTQVVDQRQGVHAALAKSVFGGGENDRAVTGLPKACPDLPALIVTKVGWDRWRSNAGMASSLMIVCGRKQ